MAQMILVRGLPGSGKTTFARALAQTVTPSVIIAADDYFTSEDGDYNWDPNRLKQAHTACQERARSAFESGRTVIVHNTFTTRKEMEPYVKIAQGDVEVYSIFDGGLSDEQLAERNVHGVPVESIKRMRDRWVDAAVTPEINVHTTGSHAYWQFPTTGWLELEIT